MSDLISRQALVEDLMDQIPLAENVHIFKDIIESQPTAYDVDKVVEKISDLNENEFRYGTIMGIIRKGAQF